MTSAENSSNSGQRPPPAPSAHVMPRAEAAEASSLGPGALIASASSASGSSGPGDATYVSPPRPLAAALPAAAPAVGQRLDHFEILELIGGGGMGLVYRARDTALDRVVAIKILSTHRAADEETIRRFRNEAQSAARLDHENI